MKKAFISKDGFTMLEVMVAIGILSISLVALFAIQGGSMNLASRTKFITVANLLARSKMVDVEQKLWEEGFSDFAEEDDGDFEEEGWKDFRWRMKMTKVRIPVPSSVPGEESEGNAAANNALAAGAGLLTDLIANSLRECTVEILWEEGDEEESLVISTHFIDTKQLSGGLFGPPGGAGTSSSGSTTGGAIGRQTATSGMRPTTATPAFQRSNK